MWFPKLALPWLALIALGTATPRAAAQETPPTVVVRVRSLDTVIDHVKLLVALAGREEAAKQIEGLIKTKIGPKGLEGVDPARPLGAFARYGKDIEDVPAPFSFPLRTKRSFSTSWKMRTSLFARVKARARSTPCRRGRASTPSSASPTSTSTSPP